MIITKNCAIVFIVAIIIIGLIITNYIILYKCNNNETNDANILSTKQNSVQTNNYKEISNYTNIPKIQNINDNKTKSPTTQKVGNLILFYANWCGACKQFKPTWNEFKKNNKLNIDIIDIDCDQKENEGLCKSQNIVGYPTVIYYNSKGDKIQEFDMERTVDGLKKFVENIQIKQHKN